MVWTPDFDSGRELADCPYCEGTGNGDFVPGANCYAPCVTCDGQGEIDADDARRLNERRASLSSRETGDTK